MLYTQTVVPELLELLKQLMLEDSLKNLRLVGGTSLSLQIGHRNSVDIDLFGSHEHDNLSLISFLNQFGKVTSLVNSKSIHVFDVDGIKVDIVNYPYNWLEDAIIEDGIRMASPMDIAAMKIAAITQRGSKKDFVDLYFLLELYSLAEMIQFYEKKITDANVWLAVRSLSFFDDADQQPTPIMFKNADWSSVKKRIIQEITIFQN